MTVSFKKAVEDVLHSPSNSNSSSTLAQWNKGLKVGLCCVVLARFQVECINLLAANSPLIIFGE